MDVQLTADAAASHDLHHFSHGMSIHSGHLLTLVALKQKQISAAVKSTSVHVSIQRQYFH